MVLYSTNCTETRRSYQLAVTAKAACDLHMSLRRMQIDLAGAYQEPSPCQPWKTGGLKECPEVRSNDSSFAYYLRIPPLRLWPVK